MPERTAVPPETIECPLCRGDGKLSRSEVLQRLGMKDYARVAQLSAEEAIRLLLKREKEAEQARWGKFELELTRRLAEATDKHQAELQKLQTEKNELVIRLTEFEKTTATTLANAKQEERLEAERELQKELITLNKRIVEHEAAQKLVDERKRMEVAKVRTELESALNVERAKAIDLDRRVKDYFAEIRALRDKNSGLEAEMAKVARVGKKEEIEFADEVRSWSGVWISDKLPRYGDYLMAFRDAAGHVTEPKVVVDNKDKASITEGDIKKLIRDAHEHKLMIAVMVTRDERQLRQVDRECRWAQEDGVWLLRSTRAWLPRDLEVLKPVFARMRTEGANFLDRNAALAGEICRTFVDLDEIEKELKKAGKAIDAATSLTVKYKARLDSLCSTASAHKLARADAELSCGVAGAAD